LPDAIRLLPEEKLKLEESVDAGKDPISVLLDFSKVARREVKDKIYDDIFIKKHHPVDIVDDLRKGLPEVKDISEQLSYRTQRILPILKKRAKETLGELKEARYSPLLPASWHVLKAALSALDIPFAPVAAYVGEPAKEAIETYWPTAPKIVPELARIAPEMGATFGAGAALKGVRTVLKGAKTLEEIEKAEKAAKIAEHATKTSLPLPPELWEGIIKRVEGLKKLEPKQIVYWNKVKAERIEKFKQEYDEALKIGERDVVARASEALKGELRHIEKTFPEFKDFIFTEEEVKAMYSSISGMPIDQLKKKEITDAIAEITSRHKVPEKAHLKALSDFLGLTKEQTKGLKTLSSVALKEVTFFPRAIMASTDLSGLFRQAIWTVGRPQFWKNIPKYITSFSKKNYETVMNTIKDDAYFSKALKARLPITDVINEPEEMFMSKLVSKIPFIGWVIDGSQRGYTGFLNKVRFDIFKDMAIHLEKTGHNFEDHLGLFQELGRYVGALTGRTRFEWKTLDGLMRHGELFFAPRLMTSRLYLMNPARYFMLPKELRMEYLRDAFSFLGFGSGVVTLGYLNGAKIVTDPRNADFMKLKYGNTRIDPWGGFQPYATFLSRAFTGEIVSSTTGKTMTLGEGYRQYGMDELFYRFLESKFAPVPAFFYHWFRGTTFAHQRFDAVKELYNMGIPFSIQDFVDLIDNEPNNLWTIPFSITGFGLQTYRPNSFYDKVDIPKNVRDFVDNELFNLKLGLPIPQTLHGIPLNVEEQDKMIDDFGKIIYPALYNLFNKTEYQSFPTTGKKSDWVKKVIDKSKETVGDIIFPYKKMAPGLKNYLKQIPNWDDAKAEKEAERIIRKYYESLQKGTPP
jgi:hypothetical protein